MYPADLNAFSQSAVMIHGDWHRPTAMVADIDGWGNAVHTACRAADMQCECAFRHFIGISMQFRNYYTTVHV